MMLKIHKAVDKHIFPICSHDAKQFPGMLLNFFIFSLLHVCHEDTGSNSGHKIVNTKDAHFGNFVSHHLAPISCNYVVTVCSRCKRSFIKCELTVLDNNPGTSYL